MEKKLNIKDNNKKTNEEQIIKMLIDYSDGFTASFLQTITDQISLKSVRQTIRKARHSLYKKSYRLVKDINRTDNHQVVYRAIKIVKGVRSDITFKKIKVSGYTLK